MLLGYLGQQMPKSLKPFLPFCVDLDDPLGQPYPHKINQQILFALIELKKVTLDISARLQMSSTMTWLNIRSLIRDIPASYNAILFLAFFNSRNEISESIVIVPPLN